ncbi:E3 ubiquitin-protein ligase TRIM38 [Orycteropus afer afer]|uniref:E3 ubiquitin-protein ligase TRIM38 n=1 Tax=Orycteropus afer afer TaxID=1230840 RepID=A0A8B7AJI0_ORYAF|nr:E3 ubiquitin-protein ligase TRIM38 [Orycteropus afer afer]
MATSTPTEKLKEEATCAICLSLMNNPVSINCGHSYCRSCVIDFTDNHPLQKWFFCPQCRVRFQMTSLRPNKQLGNLIQAIKEMNEMECKEHRERFHLFCEDEGQLICWRCERAPEHKGHTTVLVEDVWQGYKEKLQEAITNLKQLNDECMNLKELTIKQIDEWKEKIKARKEKIQSDFKNLQSFLREEEKFCLWRLEKEKEETLKRLEYNEDILERKSFELRSYIQNLGEKCQGSPQELLQDVKDTLNRSWDVKLEKPQTLSLEVNTVCNVSELYFDVKKMLRSYQVRVTLDPDTAHPELILSEDRRQVIRGCPQEHLNTSARRFCFFPCVMGCEGFTSGRHYFEVDVGEGTGWDLGVCIESVQRDERMNQKPEFGFWTIRLCKKNGYIALSSPPVSLHLEDKLLVAGVFLDYEAGVVSFYNMTTGSHIFTFPKASFFDTLRPYFQVYQYSPLFLPPPDE